MNTQTSCFHAHGLLAAKLGVLLGCLTAIAFRCHGQVQPFSDDDFTKIAFKQKLNAAVNPELKFRDEYGKEIRLGEYFGKKPIVLLLGYYRCPMLCTLTLNGLTEAMEDMKWSVGREFEIVDVSIDPSETPALALAKKSSYLRRYGRAGAESGWHFLTGDTNAIHDLTEAVGYHYEYDPVSKEYAHPSGLVILTPSGRISRYIFGVTYSARDLFPALQTASARRVGSPIEQFVLVCFHYNPITGKYGPAIMFAVRLGGIVTLLGLAGGIVFAIVREKRTGPEPAEPAVTSTTNPAPASRA